MLKYMAKDIISDIQFSAIEAVIKKALDVVADKGIRSIVRREKFDLKAKNVFYPAARAAYRVVGNKLIRDPSEL